MKNKIETILANQKLFQAALGNKLLEQSFRNQMFLGLFGELVEAMNETPFKMHKRQQKYNEQEFILELVDIQLYLFNLLLTTTNPNIQDFFQLVSEKQQQNFRRLKNGY